MLLPVYLVIGLVNIFAKSNNYNIKPENMDMDIRVRRSIPKPLLPLTGKNNDIQRKKRNFEWKNIFSGSRSIETTPKDYELFYKGTLSNGIQKESYTDISKQNSTGLNNTYTVYRSLNNQNGRFNRTSNSNGYHNSYNGINNGYNAITPAPVFYNYQNPNGDNFGGYFGQNRSNNNGFNSFNGRNYNVNNTSHRFNKTNGKLDIYNQRSYIPSPTLSPLFKAGNGSYKNYVNNSDNLLNKLLNNSYYNPNSYSNFNTYSTSANTQNTGINSNVNTNYNGFQSYFNNNNGKTQFGTTGPNFNSEFKSDVNGFHSTFSNTGNYPYNTQYRNDFTNTNYGLNGNTNVYNSQGSYYNQITGYPYNGNTGFNPFPQNSGTQSRFNVLPTNYNPYPNKGNKKPELSNTGIINNGTGMNNNGNGNNTGVIDIDAVPLNSTVLGCVICNIPCPAFMKRFKGICIDEDY